MTPDKDLEWWEKPDADPKAVSDREGLKKRIETMSVAGSQLSTRYMIRLVSVSGLIFFNGYIMYLDFGTDNAAFTYMYCLINMLVGFDALNSARKLKAIASGKQEPITKPDPVKLLPKFCGTCGEQLDYLEGKDIVLKENKTE